MRRLNALMHPDQIMEEFKTAASEAFECAGYAGPGPRPERE